MNGYVLYLLVAYGTFMTYLLSPAFGDDKQARTVFSILFYGSSKERTIELCLLLLIVFGGAGLAFILTGPITAKTALTAGLGWTSLVSGVRTTYSTSAP